MLIGAQALQGMGGAMVMPNAIALLGAAFGPEQRGWAMGIFGSVTGLGVMSGPVLGGAIAQGIDWQWIFWTNVPIGLVTAVLVRARIGDRAGPRRRLDPLGLGLVSAGSFGVVWGLVRGNTARWGSLEVLARLIGGGMLFAGLVVWGLRAEAPMLPMRLFRSRAFAAGNAATFLLSASMFGAVFSMARFQQITLPEGPLAAGLRLLPWTATLFLVALRAGKLVDRIRERPLIVSGLTMQAAGIGWIALIADPGLTCAQMIAPLVIAGAGASMTIPAVQSAVVGAVEPQQIGVAAGTFASMRQPGGAFGVAILVAVFIAAGKYASPQEFSSGFAAAIGACVGMSLAGALAALALPAARRAVFAAHRLAPVTSPKPSTTCQ